MLTGQATKRLPKSKVTSSREPPAPARACAGQRRRDTRGGGTVGDQQGQEGASRRLRRRSRRTTAPKDGPGHPTLACDDGPSAMHSSRHSAPRKPSRGLTLQLSLTSSSSGPLSSSSSSSLRRWEQQRRFSPRVSEVAQKTAVFRAIARQGEHPSRKLGSGATSAPSPRPPLFCSRFVHVP